MHITSFQQHLLRIHSLFASLLLPSPNLRMENDAAVAGKAMIAEID
jgi:hypothetical protein